MEEAHTSRRILVIAISTVAFFGFAFAGLGAYAKTYTDRVMPGLHVGTVPIGGMDQAELKQFLEDMNDKLTAEGLHFSLKDTPETKELVLYPIAEQGNAIELVRIDLDQAVGALLRYGKERGLLQQTMNTLRYRTTQPMVQITGIEVSRPQLQEALQAYTAPFDTQPTDARVVIESLDPVTYHVTPATAGTVFDYEKAIDQLIVSWSNLEMPRIEITSEHQEPVIQEKDIQPILNRLDEVFARGDLELVYEDPQTRRQYSWTIGTDKIIEWLAVYTENGSGVGFGLSYASTTAYLAEVVAPAIDIKPEDAKFEMQDGKVVEFQGSRPGVTLDVEKTFDAVNQALLQRTWHDDGIAAEVALVTQQVEPNVKTGEVNNLGITEPLGTGFSVYKGSPANRIKNIRNAVKKLNGVLIKPGEEFSAIQYTQPYTAEAGYLPELVIKGDEIKPEIGGGLCQIGTTLFRMAMNSGMPITERRNHSLVVPYYNDLENGLPGTDATIYEPAPDFRFKNDTGNYVLVQTAVDFDTQELSFTLWGTSDGRSGSYTAPVVSRWIPHGETKIIKTDKLAPGEKKCQHAYRGADASFVYTRTLSDGTKEDRTFESHYRPLPEICLVGATPEELNPEPVECPEGTECPAPAPDSSAEPTPGEPPALEPVVVE